MELTASPRLAGAAGGLELLCAKAPPASNRA